MGVSLETAAVILVVVAAAILLVAVMVATMEVVAVFFLSFLHLRSDHRNVALRFVEALSSSVANKGGLFCHVALCTGLTKTC